MRTTDSERSRRSLLSTDDVLDALGDAVAREILTVGKGGIVTVEALAERCDVSEATVYRRLRQLHDLGLVEKCAHIEAGAVSKGAYRTTIDGLTVRVTEAGVTVEAGPSDKFADAVRTTASSRFSACTCSRAL